MKVQLCLSALVALALRNRMFERRKTCDESGRHFTPY